MTRNAKAAPRRSRRPRGRTIGGWAFVAFTILALAYQLAVERGLAPVDPEATRAPVDPEATRAPAAPVPDEPPMRAADGARDPVSGLPYVALDSLPDEARTTLARIERGGPFPYARDGIVFQNREGLLPPRPRGSYHEYTVPTPGEDDRGARRIVTGPPPEAYYTDDHYASFRRIRSAR